LEHLTRRPPRKRGDSVNSIGPWCSICFLSFERGVSRGRNALRRRAADVSGWEPCAYGKSQASCPWTNLPRTIPAPGHGNDEDLKAYRFRTWGFHIIGLNKNAPGARRSLTMSMSLERGRSFGGYMHEIAGKPSIQSAYLGAKKDWNDE